MSVKKYIYSFNDRRSVFSWAMYDWANSAFATTIMAAVLPLYYSKVAASGLSATEASSYWGYTNTVAMLIIAFGAPLLGAVADARSSRIRFLAFFAFFGAVMTATLFTVEENMWLFASFLYILARLGFAAANIFYDSLLPYLAQRDSIDRVSTLGYAVGYFGGGILLALNLAMIMNPGLFGFSDSGIATRWSFLTVGLWWALFTIPILKFFNEPENVSGGNEKQAWSAGFKRVKETFLQIRKFRHVVLFLLAFWLYNDGIGTIIIMAVIFGAEINIGQEHLIGAILAVQFTGIPFTILFGKLAKKITAKRAVYLGLIVYTLIAIGGYFMTSPLHFWILAIAVGMVQGGTQALSRSLFGKMTPKSKSAEFFGFFDVSQKFSGILGPAIFGLVGQITGSSRLSILALVVFFIGGMYLLEKVRLPEGIQAAEEYDRAVLKQK